MVERWGPSVAESSERIYAASYAAAVSEKKEGAGKAKKGSRASKSSFVVSPPSSRRACKPHLKRISQLQDPEVYALLSSSSSPGPKLIGSSSPRVIVTVESPFDNAVYSPAL